MEGRGDQDGTKIAPRPFEEDRSAPQEAPQDGPKVIPSRPPTDALLHAAKVRPLTAPHGPSKTAEVHPQSATARHKRAPKAAKSGPRAAEHTKKALVLRSVVVMRRMTTTIIIMMTMMLIVVVMVIVVTSMSTPWIAMKALGKIRGRAKRGR